MSLAVVALAVALRVAWVLLVPTKPVGDFAMYVESAAHLVEHGSFDSEYVYMPGYVFLIAPVQALGGGWLATKLVGAVLGGLGAGAVIGVARRLAAGSGAPLMGTLGGLPNPPGRAASHAVALTAGLLYACWPAGIAIASVTGTDMPAAVLVLAAAYFLLRFAGPRPLLAAVLFGAVTGLAAYLRAIVVPLAALAALVFRAHGKPWRQSLLGAALAVGVALAVLSPWAVRNRLRYGETFFTDSHGGLTALVGANPNTDGCYSRSLNKMFRDVTGFALLAEPHREADRAALAVARDWLERDPRFTLGLLASKAERLLVHERALLYWPLFRAAALPEPDRAFFGRHQRGIEALADGYWLAVLALGLGGCGLALARKRWLALSLVPQGVCLALLYTAIFSEPRYRLPITMLLFPLAAQAIVWVAATARQLVRRTAPPSWKRESAIAFGVVAAVFLLAPLVASGGERLRTRHRWAVHECTIAGQPRFCTWRTVDLEGTLDGQPGVRGVWNGVGLALPAASPFPFQASRAPTLAAETEIEVPRGDYVLRLDVDFAPAPIPADDPSHIVILADGQPLAPVIDLAQALAPPDAAPILPWQARLHHDGGALRLRVRIDRPGNAKAPPTGRAWLGNLRLDEATKAAPPSP